MSCKVSMKNGINCTEPHWVKTNNLVDTTVKLAGEEAKDRLYEPKHKKKLVRVLTVIAYVFFVSLAAIMLSLYYVFLWNGGQKNLPKYIVQHEAQIKCENVVAGMPQPITASKETEDLSVSTAATEENVTWPWAEVDFGKSSTFIKKLMNKYSDD